MSNIALSSRMDAWLVAGKPLLHAEAFGAVGDGSTDDTAALQAGLDACASDGGNLLHLGPGTYKVTDSLVIEDAYVGMQGVGHNSVIRAHGDFGNVIHVEPPSNTPPGVSSLLLRDFKMLSATDRTSGAMIYTKYTHLALLSNLLIGERSNFSDSTQPVYDGIVMEDQDCMTITSCDINTTRVGIYVSGNNPATIGVNTYFNYDGWITGTSCRGLPSYASGAKGIHLAGGNGGLTIDRCDLAYQSDAIYLSGANRELFIGPHTFLDYCGNSGFNNQGTLSRLTIVGLWASTLGMASAGIRTSVYLGSCDNASIVGGRVIVAGGGEGSGGVGLGIHQTSGRLTVGNVQFLDNKTCDMKLDSGCVETIVTGCSFGSTTKIDDSSSGTKMFRGNVGVSDT